VDFGTLVAERICPCHRRAHRGGKGREQAGPTILYQTPKGELAELLDFPNLETDSPKVGREKQGRLLGQTEKAPVPEKISDAPPPKMVHKAHFGRRWFRFSC